MKNSKPPPRKGNNNQSQVKESSQSNCKDQICDICAQNVPGPEREKIFAFGKCDHYVCYVCSARLRVICDQSDCPICRNKLDTVVFSSAKVPFERFNLKNCLYDEKYKIYFENKAIKEAFGNLLKFECLKCLKTANKFIKSPKKTIAPTNKVPKDESQKFSDGGSRANRDKQQGLSNESTSSSSNSSTNLPESVHDDTLNQGNQQCGQNDEKKVGSASSPINTDRFEDDSQGLISASGVINNVFRDVFGLKNHLNYVHKLKLCELCLTHSKLFPFEFSYYDYAELRKHIREGEPKTSHRGHPNCSLCSSTFFNTDELIQHMSREHYHCHLCGRHDSNMRIYFLDYGNLREHFKTRHFLCERDHCKHEQFTAAFDNRIDYQLHLVNVHGNQSSSLSRGEARHQRTITLDSASHRARDISPTRLMRQNLPPNAALVSTGTMAIANSARQQRPESAQQQHQSLRQQRLPTRAEFPALGHTSTTILPTTEQSVPGSYVNHYPSLTQTSYGVQTSAVSSSPLSQRLTAGPSSSIGSFVRTLGGGNRAPDQLNEMDFPPLPEQPKSKGKSGNKKSKVQNNLQARNDTSELTLDQLISSSLTLSNRTSKLNGKKAGSKGGSTKPGKNMKQKSIKIQLS